MENEVPKWAKPKNCRGVYVPWVRNMFSSLSNILRCSDCCEQRCVFPEVGEGAGCPLNEFEDKVLEALGAQNG